MRSVMWCSASAVAAILAIADARAAVIFTESPVSTAVNVLKLSPTGVTTGIGFANSDGSGVPIINFETSDPFDTPAAGQARIEAGDPDDALADVASDWLSITPGAGYLGFSVIEINAKLFKALDPKDKYKFRLTAEDAFGGVFHSTLVDLGLYNLDNGEGRAAGYLAATGDSPIVKLKITSYKGGLATPFAALGVVEQIRLTAIPTPVEQGPTVPEPGTLTLLALGGLGLVCGRYRNRRKTTPSA